ncbi:hypothetical protein ACXYMW_16930, partial [Roseivivax sp. CAU 1761]
AAPGPERPGSGGAARTSQVEAPAAEAGAAERPATGGVARGASEVEARPGTDADTPRKAPQPGSGGAASVEAQPEGRVKPSRTLPGQDDLAGRKGSWRYERKD